MSKKAILFIDLDDTIFQTKRKNATGIIPVTQHENPNNISYMTKAQDIFTDIFFSYPDLQIIPVTARNTQQYNRTYLSKDKRINTFVTCFGADIHNQSLIDSYWKDYIDDKYVKLKPSLNILLENILSIEYKDNFNISISENRYIIVKNKSKDVNVFTNQNQDMKNEILKFLSNDYFIHFNSNYLSLIPKFIDKKQAVEYLINKYNPTLTIGAGDSISDYGFMSLCNYKIIPSNSQIEKLLLNNKKNFE